MDNDFINELKKTSKLIKDTLAKIPGLYCFDGYNVYGLKYVTIPDDCRCIQISKTCFEKDRGEYYPRDTCLIKAELEDVKTYMQKLGFKFKRGCKRLDQTASCFLGSINKGKLENRTHVYCYYFKQSYLDDACKLKIVE